MANIKIYREMEPTQNTYLVDEFTPKGKCVYSRMNQTTYSTRDKVLALLTSSWTSKGRELGTLPPNVIEVL